MSHLYSVQEGLASSVTRSDNYMLHNYVDSVVRHLTVNHPSLMESRGIISLFMEMSWNRLVASWT